MSKTMPIAPVFFLPVSLFVQFWGGPKGTALFRFIERETGVDIGISEKTLRKNLLEYPVKPPTKSMQGKLARWIEKLAENPRLRLIVEFGFRQLWGMRTGEADWRGMLYGASNSSGGALFSQTVLYLRQVLDEESAYYKKARHYKGQPAKLLECLYQEPFYYRYGLPIPDQLLTEATRESPSDPIQHLLKQKMTAHSLMHGCISLQMDILACAEVEWLSENLSAEPEESRYRSILGQILPAPMDDGESVTTPVEMYFIQVRKDLGYESWNDMAEFVPMDAGAEADIESKRRKLVDWTQAKRLPKVEVVDEFLESLIHRRGDYDPIYYQLLYPAAAFIERLLQLFLPGIQKLELSVEDVAAMFGTFHEHFERHKKAAILKSE